MIHSRGTISLIPAYDFGPVGEGCNVPPQGEARGVMCQVLSCTTPPTRNVGVCLLRRSRANPSAVAGPGLREARRSRTATFKATSPIPVPVSLNVLWSYTPGSGGEMMADNL